jgi:uncharacterized protein (TIGR03435 family)
MRPVVWILGLACSATATSQTLAAPAAVPEYTVASIKPHAGNNGHGRFGFRPDGFYATTLNLESLAEAAYNLYEPHQWVGWPKWASEKQWDVEAKVAPEDMDAMRVITPDQRRAMLQKLLAGRFGLVVHHEQRELPVFALVIAKHGEKLAPTAADPAFLASHRAGVVKPGPPGTMDVSAMDMAHFAPLLNFWAGRVVVDRTGLEGRYDFLLRFTPESLPADDGADTSIFTALGEQLGLKLVPGKAPVDVIVVDAAREPDLN